MGRTKSVRQIVGRNGRVSSPSATRFRRHRTPLDSRHVAAYSRLIGSASLALGRDEADGVDLVPPGDEAGVENEANCADRTRRDESDLRDVRGQ